MMSVLRTIFACNVIGALSKRLLPAPDESSTKPHQGWSLKCVRGYSWPILETWTPCLRPPTRYTEADKYPPPDGEWLEHEKIP